MPEELNKIILPKTVKQQMLEHAQASPDVEVCGLLGGSGNEVSHYYPVENIAEQPASAFYMSPQEQLDAMQIMRERKEDLIAIFHSHPDSEALPSKTDLELAAWPGVIYFIVSLQDNGQKLNSFRYDEKNFSRITIEEKAS
jgi:[CysO sulfur-carrier protein]-S-L-cysteine hydrolase